MPAEVFTIGYQGASLEELVAELSAADVSVIVDTRHTPTSRRPEFRPSSLAAALADVGIEYRPAAALGAPKELRAMAPVDWAGFAEKYRDLLRVLGEEVEALVPIVASEKVCLLCFEADPAACHRSLLAHELKSLLDVSIGHLRPRRADEPDNHERLWVSLGVANNEVKVSPG